MISDNLNRQIIEAMKAHDEVRVSTLKLLANEIHLWQIDHPQMTAEEEMALVKKEAKKRKDTIAMLEGRDEAKSKELKAKEEDELKILQEFLPKEVSDEELSKFVDEAISETHAIDIKQMGAVIGLVMKKAQGNADGAKIAQLVRAKL